MKKHWKIYTCIVLFIIQCSYAIIYKVNPDEQVVLTRFGKVHKGPISLAGFYFKLHNLDQVQRFPLAELQTTQIIKCSSFMKDKEIILKWKIIDPVEFYRKIGKTKQMAFFLDHAIDEKLCNQNTNTNNSELLKIIKSELLIAGVSATSITILE